MCGQDGFAGLFSEEWDGLRKQPRKFENGVKRAGIGDARPFPLRMKPQRHKDILVNVKCKRQIESQPGLVYEIIHHKPKEEL